MQLNDLKAKQKRGRKRVGRGGKRGTYSGKGLKGQTSRAGKNLKPAIRDLIKRYPKLRGYRFGSLKRKETIVDVGLLDKNFEAGEVINPKKLVEKRIIDKIKGRIPEVKILGEGEVKNNFIVENCRVSKSAKEKIEKAGGEIK